MIIDPVQKVTGCDLIGGMEKRFRPALLWHMEKHGTTIAELARGSGVTEAAIKKLRVGASQSTDVDRAVAIARFYGKSVEAFMNCSESAEDDMMRAVLFRLTDAERQILHAQIRGILATRGSEAG